MCISVDVPNETKLVIAYDAPDLVSAADNDTKEKKDPIGAKNMFHKELEHSHITSDKLKEHRGLDNIGDKDSRNREEYERKRKEKLQAMVAHMASSHADMEITVTKKRGRPLEKFDVAKKEGSFMYTTNEDGTLQICTQSIMASRLNPRRIHLNLSTVTEKITYIAPDQSEVESHLSTLETRLSQFADEMESILDYADYSKSKEVEFHKQSLEMNAAATWWPLIQIVVLIFTGFSQANYMVQFFKRRHLI